MAEFAKKDLETGMVIELNTGEKYLVLKGHFVLWDRVIERFIFMSETTFDGGHNIDEDLNFGGGRYVIKVYSPSLCGLVDTLEQCGEDNILWERKLFMDC